MSRELAGAEDPRSRALAALMLGATQDPAAGPPLCHALSDPSDLVRAAAARALGQVHDPDAQGCLSAHAQDASPNVRAAITRAEQALAIQAHRRPFLSVAFAEPGADPLLRLAEDAARRRLTVLGAELAPAGESALEAKRRLGAKKLGAVRLSFEIARRGGSVQLTLRCAHYPDGGLIGRVVVSAAHAGEEVLVRDLAARAIDLAAADFDWRP